nr:MAG: RNA-dependent RNA polymerase [Mitovirus sp.]
MRFIYLPVYVLGQMAHWKLGYRQLGVNIKEIWVKSGPKFTAQYLSECARALICWLGNEKFIRGKTRISLTKSGLPKIIPIYLRKLIRPVKDGSDSSKLVFRVVLTALSVYRVIGHAPIYKWETITDPFKGVSPVLPEVELQKVLMHIQPIKSLRKPNFLKVSESSGPNYPRATWSSALDAFALVLNWKQFIAWYKWCRHYKWDLPIVWLLMVVVISLVSYPIVWVVSRFTGAYTNLELPSKLLIGKLATVKEARGKVRVVAIVDYWSQLVLMPLHLALFSRLRRIHQDGTFDQGKPLLDLLNRCLDGRKIYSYDLSAATDRLPQQLQVQILNLLGVPGDLWITMLNRDYYHVKRFENEPSVYDLYRYAVGQPMGAYSSWGMLALTHHVIVQVAASRVGLPLWFRDYAVLGDDIIIANDLVANSYKAIMTDLGVEINMAKSHEGSVAEFAKRWIHPLLGEFTPVGAGNILTVVRNTRLMPNLIMDSFMKGYPFIWNIVDRGVQHVSSSRAGKMAALATAVYCLGPSGILHKGTKGPASWLGTLATKYYGGTEMLPNLLNALLYARLLDRSERVEKENARNRKAAEDFKSLWTLYPLDHWYKTMDFWIRVSPKARDLRYYLGLDGTMDSVLQKPRNPLASLRVPWPIQINLNRFVWAGVQRISPGFYAYSQDPVELDPRIPQTSWEHELKRNANIIKWAASRPESMDMLIQTSLDKLARPLDNDDNVRTNVDLDWDREMLSADFVYRTLTMHKRVMELIHPPLRTLDPSVSLVLYQGSADTTSSEFAETLQNAVPNLPKEEVSNVICL